MLSRVRLMGFSTPYSVGILYVRISDYITVLRSLQSLESSVKRRTFSTLVRELMRISRTVTLF